MLEIISSALLILWVLGLVTGFSDGLAIHILLLAALVLYLIDRVSAARAGSAAGLRHRRALIPSPHAPLAKGGLRLTPRLNNRGPRAAPSAPSARPGLSVLAQPAPALPPRAPRAAAG